MAGKRYLGDAVYVEVRENGDVKLTTEDGLRATNTIYLEPDVIKALCLYLDQSFSAERLLAMLRRTLTPP
jgi:hypothetical protein